MNTYRRRKNAQPQLLGDIHHVIPLCLYQSIHVLTLSKGIETINKVLVLTNILRMIQDKSYMGGTLESSSGLQALIQGKELPRQLDIIQICIVLQDILVLISFDFTMFICLFSYTSVNFTSLVLYGLFCVLHMFLGSNYAWKGLGVD